MDGVSGVRHDDANQQEGFPALLLTSILAVGDQITSRKLHVRWDAEKPGRPSEGTWVCVRREQAINAGWGGILLLPLRVGLHDLVRSHEDRDGSSTNWMYN